MQVALLTEDQQATVNTTFDILLEPDAAEGFEYLWVPWSQIEDSQYTVFELDGHAPCCITLTAADRAQIG